MNEEFVGNLSTIIKILILTFVPAAFLEQVDANTLSVALTVIIMFIFSIIDAKYPNTFGILKNTFQIEENDNVSTGEVEDENEETNEEITEEGV